MRLRILPPRFARWLTSGGYWRFEGFWLVVVGPAVFGLAMLQLGRVTPSAILAVIAVIVALVWSLWQKGSKSRDASQDP